MAPFLSVHRFEIVTNPDREGLESTSGFGHVGGMPGSEPARHALYARLEEVLGPEHAETLMTHLPPQPAEHLATRTDIDRMEDRFNRMEDRFDRLEDRFDMLTGEVREMHAVMRDQLRTYTLSTLGSLTALTGIFALIVAMIR